MKGLRICLAVMMLWSLAAAAQTVEVKAKPITDDDVKLLRQDIQSVKDDVITKTMEFSPEEQKTFWPVYREYSAKQHEFADRRLKIITEYAQKLDKMDDATANSLTDRMLQLEDDYQALRRTYYPKFVQSIGAKRAAKFFQVDNRLSMMVNVQLASEVPLIP